MAEAPQTAAERMAAERLAQARRAGEPAALAEALVERANQHVLRGELSVARAELDEATALHHDRGSHYDEARCAQLAAALYRLTGDYAAARARAGAALAASGGDNPAAVAALAELGDIALAEKQGGTAVDAYTRALDLGHALGPNPPAEALLLRHRAMARALSGDALAAADDLEQALVRLDAGDDVATARRVRVEFATACQDGGDLARAVAVVDAAWPQAEAAADHAVLADLALLRSAQALARDDAPAALAHAATAREHALAGRAPQAYIAAAVALGQLHETLGERAAAYAALASGWVTLADLLGPELARQAFQPPLAGLRARWGAAAFDAVKRDYEARQRQARTGGRS